MLSAVEALPLSPGSCRVFVYKIVFKGICDNSSVKYLRSCVGKDNVRVLIDKKHCKVTANLLSSNEARYVHLLLVQMWNLL